MHRQIVFFLVALALGATVPAFGHGGGLDKQGCHNDRKRGGYHCHRGAAPTAAWAPAAAPRSRSAPSSSWAPANVTPGGGAFANCSAARAAGAAPVRRGDPGYSLRLDRDGDGVGCE